MQSALHSATSKQPHQTHQQVNLLLTVKHSQLLHGTYPFQIANPAITSQHQSTLLKPCALDTLHSEAEHFRASSSGKLVILQDSAQRTGWVPGPGRRLILMQPPWRSRCVAETSHSLSRLSSSTPRLSTHVVSRVAACSACRGPCSRIVCNSNRSGGLRDSTMAYRFTSRF